MILGDATHMLAEVSGGVREHESVGEDAEEQSEWAVGLSDALAVAAAATAVRTPNGGSWFTSTPCCCCCCCRLQVGTQGTGTGTSPCWDSCSRPRGHWQDARLRGAGRGGSGARARHCGDAGRYVGDEPEPGGHRGANQAWGGACGAGGGRTQYQGSPGDGGGPGGGVGDAIRLFTTMGRRQPSANMTNDRVRNNLILVRIGEEVPGDKEDKEGLAT